MSLLAASLLLGQVAGLAPRLESGVLTLSDRSELRLRAVQFSSPEVDVTNTVTSAISVTAPLVSYSIGYGLSFTDADIAHTGDRALSQSARAGVTYGRRRFSLTASAAGAYGTTVGLGISAPLRLDQPGPGSGTPAGTTPAGPGAPLATYVPPTEVLKTGSLTGSVAVAYVLSRNWSFAVTGSGAITGGIDFVSQEVAPPSRTGFGGVSVGYKLTKDDQLTTRFSGSYIYVLATPQLITSTITPGGWFVTNDLFESWTHNFTKRTATALGAGISFVHSNPRTGAATDGFFATGNAGVSYTEPLADRATLSLAGTIAVSTTYNPVVATVQHQGSIAATSSWTWRKLSAALTAAGASALPVYAPYSTRFASLAATLGYTPAPFLQVQGGVRGNAEVLHDRNLGAATPPDWGVFLALLVVAPPIRL